MNKDNKNLIPIKDIASLMRLTPEAIRYYEKRNIIKPYRNEANGYRYYSSENISRMETCRKYQELGFSLNEVNSLFSDKELSDILVLLQKKKTEAEETIKREELKIQRINELENAIKLYELYNGKYYIMDSLHCYCCYYMEYGSLNRKAIQDNFFDMVSSYENFFIRIDSIDTKRIGKEPLSDIRCQGYSIQYKNAKKLGMQKNDNIQELVPERSLYTVAMFQDDITEQDLKPILRWINRSNFRMESRMDIRTLASFFENGSEKSIYEIRVPLTEYFD